MGRCRADGHPQLLREIKRSETQAEVESLRRQLKPRGRHEKDVCTDADMVLMRMIAGTALMVSLISRGQLVLLAMTGIVVVVFVAVNVAVRTR